jgi:hypothetical protein
VSSSGGSTVVGVHAGPGIAGHLSVGVLVLILGSKAIVCAVKSHVDYAGVALDTGSLLKATGKVLGNVAEDGNLALDDFLLGTGAHVTRDVLDKTLSGGLIEDLLIQGTGCVEVLLTDLGQEGDSLSGKVTVGSVEVEGAGWMRDKQGGSPGYRKPCFHHAGSCPFCRGHEAG